jgi:signal transduction histidine kinase
MLAARCLALARAIGLALSVMGLAVLVGWANGLERTAQLGSGPLMKPNAALCFILAGLALFLPRERAGGRAIATALAAAAVALGLATMAEWAFSVDLRIDQRLFLDTTKAYTSVPGRMAPNTALAFSLLGVALLLVQGSGWRLRLGRSFAVVALSIGAIAAAGYLYGVSTLFAVAKQTAMALPAALGIVALATAVLLSRPDVGTSALLVSDGAGGGMARRLLPIAAIVPVALALPAQAGVRSGLLDQAYASALVTVGLTGVLVWTIARSARAVELREAALRQTAARLAAREVELSASNHELEAFSYSVSHDLRSPLRSIDGFSLALAEDCAGALPPVGLGHIERIRAATQRMGRLIDDLLQLSRVSRTEMHREPVDLTALARGITADLARTATNRRVEFEIEDGLAAFGDPTLLRVVLENLIGNAWKFTSRHTSARIGFGRTTRDGRQALFVRDDGAGFDMAYAAKLFGAFQRLHGAREFAGTGIGLASVQRIVRRHGGEIWADGAVEQGATFTFTLPGTPGPKGDRR